MVTHEYIAKGPDLYMRQNWPDGSRDCWLAYYGSDEAAQKAAARWNERKKEFDDAQQTKSEGE